MVAAWGAAGRVWCGVRKARENEKRGNITSRQKKLSHLLKNTRGWYGRVDYAVG